MNPTLLKDLILAGHRVACKTKEWEWRVFLLVRWDWQFQWTDSSINIEWCISIWLSSIRFSDAEIKEYFTWEYKIVTPLPQLPQVWDTVEVLDICREIPWFDKRPDVRKDMVWKKYPVWNIDYWQVFLDICYFPSRAVAKCEREKAQSIQSEEQFWDTIVVNWRTYKAI